MNESNDTASSEFQYDVITLGEGLLRFTPPLLDRLEQASLLEVEVGGSEANVAVGLARLGLRTAWLSRMTDNGLGRLITRKLASNGVDTSHVLWTPDDRVGVYYLERARAPRMPTVIYDREGSAMSRMRPEDIPLRLFAPGVARWLHVSGITAAISHEGAETTIRAIDLARQAGLGISFDFNLRTRLWSGEAAARRCASMIGMCDLFIISRTDAAAAYDILSDSPEAVARSVASKFPGKTIVVTLSKDGAAAIDPAGNYFYQPAFPAEVVGRIGGGDAFNAGFLRRYLSEDSSDRLPQSLRWGAAAAALKYSLPGDMPLIDIEDVKRLVSSNAAPSGELMR
jgi:2-dehydro-3-deoxygluconokinase